MVNTITGLSRSGVKDWFIQRVSAVIMALYVFFLLGFVLGHPHLSFASWAALFASMWMKAFTLLALMAIIAHAWVGIWTVFTDYISCSVGRAILQILVTIALFFCLIWGIHILWG